MSQGAYERRMTHYQRRGARRMKWWTVLIAVVLCGLGLGLGTVASRAAARPSVAAGGGRTMSAPTVASKWVQAAVQRLVRGHRVPSLLMECRKRRCAAYSKDGGYQATMIHLADGRWHVLTIMVPDIVTTQ